MMRRCSNILFTHLVRLTVPVQMKYLFATSNQRIAQLKQMNPSTDLLPILNDIFTYPQDKKIQCLQSLLECVVEERVDPSVLHLIQFKDKFKDDNNVYLELLLANIDAKSIKTEEIQPKSVEEKRNKHYMIKDVQAYFQKAFDYIAQARINHLNIIRLLQNYSIFKFFIQYPVQKQIVTLQQAHYYMDQCIKKTFEVIEKLNMQIKHLDLQKRNKKLNAQIPSQQNEQKIDPQEVKNNLGDKIFQLKIIFGRNLLLFQQIVQTFNEQEQKKFMKQVDNYFIRALKQFNETDKNLNQYYIQLKRKAIQKKYNSYFEAAKQDKKKEEEINNKFVQQLNQFLIECKNIMRETINKQCNFDNLTRMIVQLAITLHLKTKKDENELFSVVTEQIKEIIQLLTDKTKQQEYLQILKKITQQCVKIFSQSNQQEQN